MKALKDRVTLRQRVLHPSGLLADLEVAAYCGKETGETALMRKLLGHVRAGDVLLGDCYHCSDGMIADGMKQSVNLVMKNHHLRDDHPAQCVELNKHERLVIWSIFAAKTRPGSIENSGRDCSRIA